MLPVPVKAELSVSETAAISFGRVLNIAGGVCTMDPSDGSLSGETCLDWTGTAGAIAISGDPGRAFSLELISPGGPVNRLTFTPLLAGGGNLGSYSLDGGGNFPIAVGGTLEADAATPPSSGSTVFTYTVRVNYE